MSAHALIGAAEGRLGEQAPLSGGSIWSTAGDEGHDDVGRVAVEVLAAPVVDGRCPRVGVPRRDLHLS
jgi:hypothetical protein